MLSFDSIFKCTHFTTKLIALELMFVQLLSHVRLFCDPRDCGSLDSSVCGIFQARVQVCIAISFSRGSSRPRDGTRGSAASPAQPADPLPLSFWGIPASVPSFCLSCLCSQLELPFKTFLLPSWNSRPVSFVTCFHTVLGTQGIRGCTPPALCWRRGDKIRPSREASAFPTPRPLSAYIFLLSESLLWDMHCVTCFIFTLSLNLCNYC